jgi:hypothetical protein
MQKIQLPSDIFAKIGNGSVAAELCDEAGAAQAVVLPIAKYRELLLALSPEPFTEEELQRARAEPGGYTTAEAIAYLRKLLDDRSKQ